MALADERPVTPPAGHDQTDPTTSTPAPPAPNPRPAPAAPDAAANDRRAGSWTGSLALTALVSIACGLGGAYAYERFLAPRPDTVAVPVQANAADRPGTETTTTRADGRAVDARDLADRLDTLAKRTDAIQNRVEAQARSGPPPEVTSLQVRIADLTEMTNKLAPLPSQIDHLSNRVNELSGTLVSVRDDVKTFQSHYGPTTRLASSNSTPRDVRPTDDAPEPDTTPAREPAPEASATPTPDARRPDAEKPSSGLARPAALSAGADLFRRGRYKEARKAFDALEASNPEDARVWYYAALSYGFTTRDWTEGAVGLVQKGVAREEAGTPRTAEIDNEFKALKSSEGKDWLAAFRKRFRSHGQ